MSLANAETTASRSGAAVAGGCHSLSPYPPSSAPDAASLDEPSAAPQGVDALVASHNRRLAWLAYVAVCVFWGTSSPLLRFTVGYVPPLSLVVLRFFLAGGMLWVALWALGRRPPVRNLTKILPIGVALACTNTLVTFGFKYVEAGAGTLVLASTAVAFAVVDICWPGGTSKPSSSVWLGLVLGLLGVAVLVLSPNSFGESKWEGYLLLALSTWTWALAGVGQARHPSGLDPLQSSAWQMLIAAVLVLPLGLWVEGLHTCSIPLNGWLGILALVVTASIIAFVGFVYMLRELPAYVVGSYPYVNALVAAGLGVLWLGERLSARYCVSAALVLGGVALIQRRAWSRTA